MKNKRIMKMWALFLFLPLVVTSLTQAAISITIASPNSTSGLILDSKSQIVTSGFARVGKITGTIDLGKKDPTFSNYQYWDSIFVDVNDPTTGTGTTLGGGGSTPAAWNFSSAGALSSSSTGVLSATFPQNTQLYIWAFKVSGKTLTTTSAGSSSVSIPALDATDFTNGVEWALLTADEWKAPADLGTIALVISQITAADTIQSPIFGSDLGASVTMIPEPSTSVLMSIGLALLLIKGRKTKALKGFNS